MGHSSCADVLANEFQLADQLEDVEQLGVSALSSDGRAILGLASRRGVDNRVVAWIATIPEPSGMTLLAVGGLALICRLRPDRRGVPYSTTWRRVGPVKMSSWPPGYALRSGH